MWADSYCEGHSTITQGVEVIERNDYNYSEVADRIKDVVAAYASMSDDERQAARKAAHKLSQKALWKNFIKYYYEAYDIALAKRDERCR